MDYDVPVTQKERERRASAQQRASMASQMQSSPPRQDTEYLLQEQQRREKMASMLATKAKRISDASSGGDTGGSRPLSNASSVYSADASSLSYNSSQSSTSKLAGTAAPEEGSILLSESSIDQQLEMIDQLVEDVVAQNTSKMKRLNAGKSGSPGPPPPQPPVATLPEVNYSKVQRSPSGNLVDEEGTSSNSGSVDNLRVWDDITSGSESDSDEGIKIRVLMG